MTRRVNSLLTKAKRMPVHRNSVALDDRVSLSLAWLQGQVQPVQIMRAVMMKNQTSMYGLLCSGLKEAYRRGLLKVKS